MIDKLIHEFTNLYGENSNEIKKFFSPSRINIIGEHIDYNGGKVFPCAIEIGTYGIARKNDQGLINLASMNMDLRGQISLKDLNYKEENNWMNYPVGVIKFLEEEGHKIGGLDILIYGNIPNGSGLSSSSSLELLIGEIVNVFYNEGQIDKLDLVKIGKRTENEFIGVNSGIMDQFIIGLGKKDHAMLIDTNSLEYDYYPFDLKDNKIVILNTNKRRELKDSKYNVRREECDQALDILKTYKENINYLCDLGKKDLPLLHYIGDENIRNRAEHAIKENLRVMEAAQALEKGNIVKLGQLLVESNDSLRDLYEVTGPHLDAITKHANDFDGCLGARMTGAGFGGCGIAIVKENMVNEFINYVGPRYEKDTGLKAEFIISDVGNGVTEI